MNEKLMNNQVTVKLIISGSVQRVGFRNHLYSYVHDHYLAIRGSIHNLSNGNVEVIAQGGGEEIAELERYCYHLKKGSISVESIEKLEIAHIPNLPIFTVVY